MTNPAPDNKPQKDTPQAAYISAQDLLSLGVDDVAYVRPVRMMGRTMFAVHAADGTPISIAEDEVAAHTLISGQDLDAVRVN
jgi:hypothetical protein